MKPWNIFISVLPGLEQLASEELQELGITPTRVDFGGIECVSHPRKLFQIIPYLRIASRVLIRIGSFKSKHFSLFEKEFTKLNFSQFLSNQPIKAKVECHHCALYHKGAIAERIESYLNRDREVDSAQPTQIITCLGQDNEFTISIDACGEHLHKRGLLTKRGEAPLRENIAAALIRALKPQTDIWDPFCGSGTILSEAKLYHSPESISAYRPFSFQTWNAFLSDPSASETLKHVEPQGYHYYGSDLDANSIQIAKDNLSPLNFHNLKLEEKDFYNQHPKSITDQPLTIITNPPYGERLPFQKLNAQFKAWKEDCPDLQILALLPSTKGLANSETILKFKNGGIPVAAQFIS